MTAKDNGVDSPGTPDLRIVPLTNIIEHELNDAQRTEPLARRLQAEQVLKNPPIVTPLDENGRFVVLDGANRTLALEQLGYPCCLVQVVAYTDPPVVLSTWHHVITGLPLAKYVSALRAIDGIDITPLDLPTAQAGLAAGSLLAYTQTADGQVLAARAPAPNLLTRNRLLNALVNTYKASGRLYRAASDSLTEARQLYPDITALMVFPRYQPAEVLSLARGGQLLPPGLTRHIVQGRALRINYPLSQLSDAASLTEQNKALQSWIMNKASAKEIRYYGEATVVFDE